MLNSFIFSFLIFIGFNLNTFAQLNLVPNPSFEDTVFCPNSLNDLNAVAGWQSWGGTPDYFNRCSIGVGIPHNGISFQEARTGDGMLGIVTMQLQPPAPNYREFAAAQLISPLVIGVKYYVSFNINYAQTYWVALATNNIGLKLFTYSHSVANEPLLNGITHLNFDTIQTDSLNWVQASTSLIADSAYQYIALGNYFGDSLTDTMWIGSSQPPFSYYFIDDICISTDSILCYTPTAIDELISLEPRIYPNPVQNQLIIENLNHYDLIVYSMLGQSVFVNQYSKYIDVSMLSSGCYQIVLRNENKIFRIPFLKL
jgi:hypothetical protein